MKKRMLLVSGSVVVVVVTACAIYAFRKWSASREPDSAAHTSARDASDPDRVILSPEATARANLQSVAVVRAAVQHVRTIPARIEYNGLKRVDLKVPLDAVVQTVLVKPGDAVEPGTRLAGLDSPEIGLVRADVEKSQADLRIANQAVEFSEQVADNLAELLRSLRDRPRPQEVEQAFDDKVLGDHRQQVLSSYSRLILAEELWADIQPALKQGSFPVKDAKQRETNREVAKEEFLSACEQSRFEARQARDKARAGRVYAKRLVDVSRQKLKTLLGAFSENVDLPLSDRDDEAEELTRFYLIAPIAGTIEERHAAETQRVAAGTLLFTIANTDTLWVKADIREGAWQGVSLVEGAVVKVTVPALDRREFEARVEYVGRSVDSDTRAVPLIALLDNKQRLLKPGLFATVTIPVSSVEQALVVPLSAVRTHEGQDFVFVEEQPGTYRRVNVTVGSKTPQGAAILDGLTVEQRVVTQGAYLLQSELLLEPED